MDPDIFEVEGAALDGLTEHPLCAFVPASVGVSVRHGSIAQPVVLLDGMILDGRARVLEARHHRLPCPCRHFSAAYDEHPALFVGRATDTRGLTPAQCAVLVERIVRVILHRPAWLAKHDRGMADRLHNEAGRKPLLDAFGASPRHYRRAKGLRDDEALQAVFDLRISLDNAFKIRNLPTATRRRIMAMPQTEQKEAIRQATDRAKKRVRATRPLDLQKSDELFLKFVRTLRHNIHQGSWARPVKINGDSDE